MKRIYLACILTIVVLTGKSQPFPTQYAIPSTAWINYFSQRDAIGNTPTALDANSNVFLTGYAGSSASSTLVALKYDSTGTMIYNYTYFNSGYNSGNVIKVNPAGFAFLAGVTENTVTGKDYFIAKIAPSGTLVWSTTYNGTGNDFDEAVDLTWDNNGHVYVCGKSTNANNDFDITTIKLDASTGSLIWSHDFDGTNNLDDEATGIDLSRKHGAAPE